MSVASNTLSKETQIAEPASPTRSLASSVRTHYKRDFRTYDDQERIHLDWMVRNTAKILGVDAARTLRFLIAFLMTSRRNFGYKKGCDAAVLFVIAAAATINLQNISRLTNPPPF